MQNTPISARAQLALLHLTDSALPTGAFSHSFGLEDYLLRSHVHDAQTFSLWLHSYMRQMSFSEGFACRLACEIVRSHTPERGENSRTLMEVEELDQRLHACLLPRQIRSGNSTMGKRMGRIVRRIVPDDALTMSYVDGIEDRRFHGSPAIVFALALAGLGIDTVTIVRAFFMQVATSLTNNAIRGIPIGQDAGQQVLSGIYPTIEETTRRTLALHPIDFGSTPPALEFAQMSHETQLARMFMS